MELGVKALDGGDAGNISVSENIFGLESKEGILARAIRWQSLRKRVSFAKFKNRSQVAYTGSKMCAQKGLGRARHGSRSAPQFRGGGKSFGGHISSESSHVLPKKVRSLALCHALSEKLRSNDVLIIDSLVSKEPRTKYLAGLFAGLGLSNALIIDGSQLDRNFQLASRNIPNIDILPVQGINVYDILRRSKLVLSKSAVEALEDRFND
ncbi:50S ribosomal protein L4 [Candidatus Liberibacter sp.]|uniref:50S ribosomal protein L4 n=1 Tax=Candidatus Liberibacter sp. TaxID=34022 RepID=UPI0015F42937|nr:50S ribosomal protein L4 [Candidatus Liberibacter sp.]MBA5724540.1 50S ribosomal protein L4 [Candidatus Liberibacter sp.]